MTAESSVRRRITDWLAAQDIPWFPLVASAYGKRGAPDIVACLRGGAFLGIETKATDGQPSKLQLYWKRKVEQKGGKYVIARTLDDVKRTVGDG